MSSETVPHHWGHCARNNGPVSTVTTPGWEGALGAGARGPPGNLGCQVAWRLPVHPAGLARVVARERHASLAGHERGGARCWFRNL